MTLTFAFITALTAYLIGSINTSVIISKLIFKKDIREEGSGNAGATNMLRTHGKGMGVITLLLDAFKGVLCVLLANFIGRMMTVEANQALLTYLVPSFKFIGGLFAVIGHNFPVYFGFKGGKGVATSLGVMLMLNWKVGLIVLAFALVIMIVTRYVSLGSILAAVLYIAVDVSYMAFSEQRLFWPELLFTVLMAALLIFRHRSNIARLKNGTENKLGKKKEEKAD